MLQRSLLPCCLLLAACGGPDPRVDAWRLSTSLSGASALELVAPAGPLADALELRARELTAERGLEFVHVAPGAEGRAELPRIVVGTRADEHAQELAEELGVELSGSGFRYAGVEFSNPGDALVATWADPERAGLPLTLWYGNDAALLAPYLARVAPLWRPCVRGFTHGELRLEGRLLPSGLLRPETVADHTEAWELRYETQQEELEPPFTWQAPRDIDQARYEHWRGEVVRARNATKAWAAEDPRAPLPLRVTIFSDPGSMQELLGDLRLEAGTPMPNAMHALLAPGLPDDNGSGAARQAALALLGPPSMPWMLEGASVAAAGQWWGRELEAWVAHLVAGGLVPSVEELTTPQGAARTSPHLRAPLRAMLFRQLHEERGPEALRALWRGETQLVLTDELVGSFDARLAATLDERRTEQLAQRRAQRHRSCVENAPYRHGLVLQPDQGAPLASAACARSLAQAAALGADALLLDVYAYAEPGPDLWPAQRAPDTLGSELGDVEIATLAARAQALGMSLCLRPQLLSGPGGGMAGQMTHNAAEGWRGYFEELRAQLTHYALLSELLNVELLCLGSGVSNSIPTGSVVDGHGRSIAGLQLAKRNGWNDVLTRVRAAYSGALTYGADLGKGEHRRVEFWGQLDFVGIELWKPLVRLAPGEPDPTDARLQKELMRQLRQVALAGGLAVEGEPGRAPLPVLLLGVGFPSSHDAWQRPSVPMGERDLERQVQLYEHLVYAMGKVYTDQGFAQPEGLFVHAWSAHPAAGGAWDRGHALQGKPALEAVRALFELP